MGRSSGRHPVPFRPTTPWWDKQSARLLFEVGLAAAYPRARRRLTPSGPVYGLVLDVPFYEARTATVHVNGFARVENAAVTVDGPTESPHRYEGGFLCMWEPSDPPDMKWLATDGMVALLDHVTLHPFREAWWRETGTWPGAAASHERAAPKTSQ